VTAISAGAPMTPGRDSAQQQAAQELAQGKYHVSPSPAPPSASPTPSVASPSPSPTPTPKSSQHHTSAGTILLVILVIAVVGTILLVVLRRIGKPRKDEKTKPEKTKRPGKAPAVEIPLTGAALQRHNAELAARDGDWQEAIRARFRAVISELDERSLLPERADRTAHEAAQDAGSVLPEHAAPLLDAARAFDEVEYGDYLGTPEGYAVISAVDEAVGHAARAAVRR
jgi:Domain of unknown function (DUF4129)